MVYDGDSSGRAISLAAVMTVKTIAGPSAAIQDEKYGRRLEEQLARLREQRAVLQKELNLAGAALSPTAETPEADSVASIVYDDD